MRSIHPAFSSSNKLAPREVISIQDFKMSFGMMVNSIRDLNLHDSEWLEIVIKMDEVTMRLGDIEDYETMRCSRRDLIFRGCTEMSLKINGGYAPPDSILVGGEFPSDRGQKVRVETNTTASVIEITASEIKLI